MARSYKKLIYQNLSILKKAITFRTSLKNFDRSFCLSSFFIGRSFLVYNGKKFQPVTVLPGMLKQRLGEFSLTRAVFVPKQKKKQIIKKKFKKVKS